MNKKLGKLDSAAESISSQSVGITSSLAFVLMAKKNSYCAQNSQDEGILFHQPQYASLDLLSSSPGSAYSVDSYDEDFNQLYYHSNISTETSISCADEDHPLIRKYEIDEFIVEPQVVEAPQKSFVSNLSASLKKFTSTKFILPSIEYPVLMSQEIKEIQLETFDTKSTPLVDSWDLNVQQMSEKTSRSCRSSSLFLKLYAIENVCQQRGILPNIFQESDTKEHDLEFVQLGEIAKCKLFDVIKLEPRTDLPAHNNLKNSKYQLQHREFISENSLINRFDSTKHITPWIQFQDVDKQKPQVVLNTHGIMKNNLQYTVKGYANTRWKSTTIEQ